MTSMDPRRPAAGSSETDPVLQPLSSLFLVMFARAIGYVALFLLTFIIARRAAWSFSVADGLFWACAIAIPIARRRAAIRYRTAWNGPAPALLRSLATHAGVAVLIWTLAQSVQFAA